MKNKEIKKYLLKESYWFFIIALSLIVASFLVLSFIVSGTLDVIKEQIFNLFLWNGWEAVSVIALIVTAFYIGQQSYFTRKVFQFQTIPSVAFSLMANKTYFEKMNIPYYEEAQDTHFMIYNLSNFPISFWIEIEDDSSDRIFNGGPWRINPKAFFKPHSLSLVETLERKNKSEIYVTISYSSLHNDKLKVFERPERWRLNERNRWVDRHGMEDVNDRYWDRFLAEINRDNPNQKGTTGI